MELLPSFKNFAADWLKSPFSSCDYTRTENFCSSILSKLLHGNLPHNFHGSAIIQHNKSLHGLIYIPWIYITLEYALLHATYCNPSYSPHFNGNSSFTKSWSDHIPLRACQVLTDNSVLCHFKRNMKDTDLSRFLPHWQFCSSNAPINGSVFLSDNSCTLMYLGVGVELLYNFTEMNH